MSAHLNAMKVWHLLAVLTVLAPTAARGQSHSANVSLTHDPVGDAYLGASNPPSGSSQISLVGANPGYLNGIYGTFRVSQVESDTTVGEVIVTPVPVNSIELLAVSITVSDTAGQSHSLSSLSDAALGDIVNDLNAGTSQVDAPVTTYAFTNAPSQFSGYLSALAAGESATGGRTFDLVLAATPPASNSDVWGLDLSNEVGHLDGITSLSATDIAAIATPEPNTIAVVIVALVGLAVRRRRASKLLLRWSRLAAARELKMAPHCFSLTAATMFCIVLWSASSSYGQTHSADAEDGGDTSLAPFYTGTSHPSGPGAINIVGSTPGYLNGMSGGVTGGSAGEVLVGGVPQAQLAVIGLAIHVSDTAGPSHSLSTQNDPALTDIVNDLNASTIGGMYPLTAYAFGSPPAQFSNAVSALSSGEASNGGQPFDILLTGQGPGEFGFYLTVDFDNELGNLDGITALSVTDIGAVPEPGMAGPFVIGVSLVLALRRRQTAA